MAEISLDSAYVNPKVDAWCKEFESAELREKDWRKLARDVVCLYEAQRADGDETSPFNILYSNTETLAPALYNNVPRPVVERKFKDADPLGKVAAEVTKRLLVFLLDNELEDSPTFDEVMQQVVLEGLVPGRGVSWYRYEATMDQAPGREVQASGEVLEDVEGAEPGAEPVSETPADPPAPVVSSENVTTEIVPWDRLLMGYGKVWQDVPWVARKHFMSREELIRNFPEYGAIIPLDVKESASEDSDKTRESQVTDAQGANLALVYEVWDKESRKVYFIANSWRAAFLREVSDPLNLTGFFPCPEPLTFFRKIRSMVPVPLYALYKEQAKELNEVSRRIISLIRMLKVRGAYDSTCTELANILKGEDGAMVPVENTAALLGQGSYLEKALWFMPLEKLITVIQQLFVERQQTKQVIYEITGISDIIRGASVASETATAQELKSEWGSLRLKRGQKIVRNYVRKSLRIMAEIAVKKFSVETIAKMTGMNFPTAVEKQRALMILQQAQMTGQPPPPEVQHILSQPTWDDVLGLLRDDQLRNYRIDIETNSTVDAEATEDKQDLAELLNAVSQFFNGVAPMVQSGVLPFEAAKSMLLAVVRRYRLGTEVEDSLAQMQAPQPQGEDGGKAQAEQQKLQMELQLKKAESDAKLQEMQMEARLKQLEMQLKERELQIKLEMMNADYELKQADQQLKRQGMQDKAAYAQQANAMKQEQLRQQAQQPRPTKAPKER